VEGWRGGGVEAEVRPWIEEKVRLLYVGEEGGGMRR